MSRKRFVVWFDEVDKEDIPLVGGKGANLGEMTKAGFPVPGGFIITAAAYFHFVSVNNLEGKIRKLLTHLDVNEPASLNHASKEVKQLIVHTKLPDDLAGEIIAAYHTLGHPHKDSDPLKKIETMLTEPLVAVRSSATAEDLPTASFAGQQATFLNVQGDVDLLEKVRECYASLFEARAIFYRKENSFDHFKVGIAVPVQKMVQSDTSGVMFTIDPITNNKTTITIEAVYGLGEMIVQGSVTPDHYEIDKRSLSITNKQIARQDQMMIKVGKHTKETKVPSNIANKQKIGNGLIEELARIGKKIEHHYFFPQDIEWAVEDGKIYIVQTRPITTTKGSSPSRRAGDSTSKGLMLLFKGDPASPGIRSGPVKVILNASQIGKIKPGDVLVAPKTNPDYVPAMRKAAAIVTDRGGRTSHAAIVSRELGIPCVVGAEIATKRLKTGAVVTVNGATGEVFRGGIAKSAQEAPFLPGPRVGPQLKTATKVYVNLAEPERAAEVAQMDVDGVGLLRAEFMIAQIGVHPKKIIKDRKQKIYIDAMVKNLSTFCEHFNPRPVVYRLSDFKTNEYRNLKGGSEFEPEEENPMLGFRGAFRFIEDPKVLELEVEAIKKVRNELGFKNLWVMIPYVRTVHELSEVKKLLGSFGLHRSPTFSLWMMVEIPSNVILIDEFIKEGIDGISIGSNDLTMLTLGTDRDSDKLADVFNEHDPAVIASLERVVKAARARKISSSICGQAPSTYPDIAQKLVSFGVTSISVNPDAVDTVRKTIYDAERRVLK